MIPWVTAALNARRSTRNPGWKLVGLAVLMLGPVVRLVISGSIGTWSHMITQLCIP